MKSVSEFLNDLHFVHRLEELPPIEEAFIRHMEQGLRGEASSLPMIPAYLTADKLPTDAQTVIVLDAGGTNLRTFLLKIEAGKKPEVLYFAKCPVPGKAGLIPVDTFFDQIAAQMAPIADKADRIGFCFSFPCTIQPDYDGIILYLDKELTVEGCEGASVAGGLRAALKRAGLPCEHRVIVLNDTVAALLGALAEHPAQYYSGYIGMILGTGTNCCYQDHNRRILKNELLRNQEGDSIINMEAGNFNELPITKADLLLAENAVSAEQNLSEKMMSGAYQGPLFQSLIRCAAEDGVFSEATCENIRRIARPIEAKDISSFMKAPANPVLIHRLAASDEDLHRLYELADALLERAALLAVMNLTAIMRYTDTGRDPLYPVLVAIEGATFAHSTSFQTKIRAYLNDYTERQRGYYCRIFSTEDANMVGSGIAVLMAK